MKIADLSNRTVCILGYGREGQATLRAIEKYAPEAIVTVADKNQEVEIEKHDKQTGDAYLSDLDRFDVIIKSPGIPPSKIPDSVKVKITNSTQIFLDTVMDKGSTVIGITGSAGKSTTASLIYEILKAADKDVHLVGNIGVAAIDFLDKAKEGTIFVLEMSSYQLMDTATSPQIAVITSFFPEHLDYHGTIDAYKDAKAHITRFQSAHDMCFYISNNEYVGDIASESQGSKFSFTKDDALVSVEDTQLKGEHNMINIAAACRVAKHFSVEEEIIINAIKNFKGLPHRLESLGTHHSVEWVDDAISTTPETTITAIQAFQGKIGTIILGGLDRGNDFSELGRVVSSSEIKHAILFPESGQRIRKEIANVECSDATSMEEAVNIAKEKTPKGMICLLSTASPSYNMFKDFEEKGEEFARQIRSP